MSLLGTLRVALFIIASVFAAIVVAMAGHFIFLTQKDFIFPTQPYAPLALATGALTLISLPTCLIVDAQRKGAWTSMIITEMVVLTILWVMWVATAALTAQAYVLLLDPGCATSDNFGGSVDPEFLLVCRESQVIEAFGFLSFISILIYAFVLLVFTFIAGARGHSVWFSSVKETNFFAPSVEPPPAVAPVMQYPPNFVPQQQVYTPAPIPQFGTMPMYPQYQPGSPVPFQGAPMQQIPQGSPVLQPQGIPAQPMGIPYPVQTPPPQQV
jgi:hypothetical protein